MTPHDQEALVHYLFRPLQNHRKVHNCEELNLFRATTFDFYRLDQTQRFKRCEVFVSFCLLLFQYQLQ